MHSHILSLTQVARELGEIKEQRGRKQKWFAMKIAAAVLVLCLSGVAALVFLRGTPQADDTKDGERVMVTPEPAVSEGAIKPTPVQTSEPTPKPTPKPTKKPTPKPTKKPTPKLKPTPKPTKGPARTGTAATPKPGSSGRKEPDIIPLPEEKEDLAGSLDDLD